ncbi:MAG: enoyl-CoA hydratase/isomerase family protein, partial [Rhodocyclaceae bacterium]|nr:enoyl-CoA hydratase/isomerase family protein [Rhodocyclaceae bacterium]
AQMQAELDETLHLLRCDAQVRALVLTGADVDFCSGGDISAIEKRQNSGPEAGRARMLEQHRTYQALQDFDRPVVAAVDGVAFGAGFSLAMAADIVIASDRARFCLSFARVGLIPDLGLLHSLPRMIGLQRARELIYSAREFRATEAKSLGLVLEVTRPEGLLARAQLIAGALAQTSPTAFSMTKALLARSFDMDRNALMEAEASAQGIAFESDYLKESISRFMKREPTRFCWPEQESGD